MKDTHPEIRKMLLNRFRAMSSEESLKKACNMFSTGKKFAEIAVKRQHQSLTGIDLKVAVFRWIYKREFAKEELDTIENSMREFHSKCSNT